MAAAAAAPLTVSAATTSPSRPSLPSSSAAFLPLPSPPRSLHLRHPPPTLTFFNTRAGSTRQRRPRPPAIAALASDEGELGRAGSYEEWNEWTAKFAGAANLPFLLLQLPQIVLNARNLMAGNTAALRHCGGRDGVAVVRGGGEKAIRGGGAAAGGVSGVGAGGVRERGQEDEAGEAVQGVVRQRPAEEGEESGADQGQGGGAQVHPLAPPFQANLIKVAVFFRVFDLHFRRS